MSETNTPGSDRTAALRTAFDEVFAKAPLPPDVAFERLLGVRIGGDPFAVRMSEVAGVFSNRRITRLPGVAAALLGLVGVRGTVLPVYDLGQLLGYTASASHRWVVTVANAPLALAVAEFDGYLHVRHESIVPAAAGGRGVQVMDVVRVQDISRPVVALASLVESIRTGAAGHP